jgi:hypothetical protein
MSNFNLCPHRYFLAISGLTMAVIVAFSAALNRIPKALAEQPTRMA